MIDIRVVARVQVPLFDGFIQPADAGDGRGLVRRGGVEGFTEVLQPGFLLFLGRIIYRVSRAFYLKNVVHDTRFIHIGLLCAMFGIILFEVFNTSYFIGKMWLTIGLALASAHLLETQSKKQQL